MQPDPPAAVSKIHYLSPRKVYLAFKIKQYVNKLITFYELIGTGPNGILSIIPDRIKSAKTVPDIHFSLDLCIS